jgi:hypothetical protein
MYHALNWTIGIFIGQKLRGSKKAGSGERIKLFLATFKAFLAIML